MATLAFNAGQGANIANLQGSGLGFYGSGGGGTSVLVGEWQDSTFVASANGLITGAQADNIKYPGHLASGLVNGNGPYPLTGIPNVNATLNINFSHSTAVAVQNARARIYDRTTTTSAASGVHCRFAEIRNLNGGVGAPLPATTKGSGDTIWRNGSVTGHQEYVINLAMSPGYSGEWSSVGYSGGTAKEHDWYLAISASPESIGSKTEFGLYVNLEYL